MPQSSPPVSFTSQVHAFIRHLHRAWLIMPLWEKIGLAGVLALAILTRWWNLAATLPFTYDQGRDMYVLQEITRGNLTLIGPTTGLPGVFLGPYYYYFLLPGFILGQGSPFIVAKWLVVMCTLALIPLHFLLRPVMGRVLALTTLFWLAINPGAINQARTIWNPSLVTPTLIVGLTCLFFARRWQWLLPISLMAFGLSLQTELAYTFFLAPVIGLWLLWHSPLNPHASKQKMTFSWIWLGIAVASFMATLLPQLLFDLRNQGIITTSVLREMSDPAKQIPLAQALADHPAPMLAELNHVMFNHLPGGNFGVVVVLLAGVLLLITPGKHADQKRVWAGYLFLPLLGILFHTGNYGAFFSYYITAHHVPMIIVSVLALQRLVDFLNNWSLRQRPLVLGVAVVLILVGSSKVFYSLVSIYDEANFQYSGPLQIQALLYARQHPGSSDQAMEVFVPNLIPLQYQYLNEWLAQTHQTKNVQFGITGQTEYSLIYEPITSDGSLVAFRDWKAKWLATSNCINQKEFGIITVAHCQKQ